jgi:hypothetical protein
MPRSGFKLGTENTTRRGADRDWNCDLNSTIHDLVSFADGAMARVEKDDAEWLLHAMAARGHQSPRDHRRISDRLEAE